MLSPQLILLIFAHLVLAMDAHFVFAMDEPKAPFSVKAAKQPMVRSELLAGLQIVKFQGLPESLLADRDSLVRELEMVIKAPPGESEEATRFIRRRAIIVLGMYGGPKAVSTLRQLAEDKTEQFRRDAIVGIGRTGTGEGVALAANFLSNEDELFREAAIDALGASNRKEALVALRRFDDSKEKPFMQRKRLEAIEKLTASVSRQPRDP